MKTPYSPFGSPVGAPIAPGIKPATIPGQAQAEAAFAQAKANVPDASAPAAAPALAPLVPGQSAVGLAPSAPAPARSLLDGFERLAPEKLRRYQDQYNALFPA